MELKLEVPRGQRILAWILLLTFMAGAVVLAWQDWRRGRWGWASAALLGIRVVQGLVLGRIALCLHASVLAVADGVLRVTPRFGRWFGRERFQVPVAEAALEWIGVALVLQDPKTGLPLRLGQAPAARGISEWLVARGVRPPVGG